ncbi:hypothetical protein A6X21_22760 [Planctopirus hydrillae]|uniref:Uncharacterized protein n=1 Tax=Planctopirus hydrillae TaxID=1841610 RepID=A0A1C3ED75_9PLAN|nr:hypothetical protein A6X21_22760 [Planctopirus hydrillae]
MSKRNLQRIENVSKRPFSTSQISDKHHEILMFCMKLIAETNLLNCLIADRGEREQSEHAHGKKGLSRFGKRYFRIAPV